MRHTMPLVMHAGIVFRNTTKSRCSHIFIGRYCRKRKVIRKKNQKRINKEKVRKSDRPVYSVAVKTCVYTREAQSDGRSD